MCGELGPLGKLVDASLRTVRGAVSEVSIVCPDGGLSVKVVDPPCRVVLWEVSGVVAAYTEDGLGEDGVSPTIWSVVWELKADPLVGPEPELPGAVEDPCVTTGLTDLPGVTAVSVEGEFLSKTVDASERTVAAEVCEGTVDCAGSELWVKVLGDPTMPVV